MSIYADAHNPPHAAGLVNAVVEFVVLRARQLSQVIKSRQDAALLAGLDDRMLADIGLTRGDVRDAVSEPVWRDPTALLVSRAYERRINRRRVSVGLDEKVFESPSIVPPAGGQPVVNLPAAWRAY